MIHSVSGSPFQGGDFPTVNTKAEQNSLASLIIPLILCNQSQLQDGQCKQLLFVHPSQLSAKQARSLDAKTLYCAKLIIEEGEHKIKLGSNAKGLQFDELAYEWEQNGDKVLQVIQRGDRSIALMDEEEDREIRELVNRTLFAKQQAKKEKTEAAEGVVPRAYYYPCRSRLIPAMGKLALFLAMTASLNSQRREKEEREREKRLDEKAILSRDARKRAEKKKEEQWQLRQEHFQIKDQNRTERLRDSLKSA